MVSGLYTTENCHTLTLDRPVQAVALDPNYYKSGSGRRFVTGDDRLILHEKVFLSRLKSTTLFEGEGPVTNIKWRGRFLAWASSTGVRVFDMNVRRVISVVKKDISPGYVLFLPASLLVQMELNLKKKPLNVNPANDQFKIYFYFMSSINSEKYRCILHWKDDLTLVVAWADDVKICVIRRRPDVEAERFNLPSHYVEIGNNKNNVIYNFQSLSSTGDLFAKTVLISELCTVMF